MTLELVNLSKNYGNHVIIKDLSLIVKNSECLALLGPSGCGKSTTLRLIAGLEEADNGKVFIDNNDVTRISPVNRRIGMVFQSYALFPHLTVLENLSLGLKVRSVPLQEQKRSISYIIDLLKLNPLINRKPAQLSGGQRQRVALARALLRDPLVYLLDEPMSNLDAQLREVLRPELRNIIINKQQPVVYVTHDQQEAMAMANKIAVLNEGNLEQIGTPKQLYEKPESTFVASFIGRPQINFLTGSGNRVIGIRPEDIQIADEGLTTKILYREWLGTNQLIFLDTPIGKIRMLCSGNTELPENIKIEWKKEYEHHFNKQTGKRID